MGGDDLVVIIATTKEHDEEKETKKLPNNSTDDDEIERKRKTKVVVTEVDIAAKFLGFSLWCAGYIIFFTVATIIVYWDVNKVGVIVSVIPPLLVSCLLILWAHSYAVKLIDSYLINPQLLSESRKRDIEGNAGIRFVCSGLCLMLDTIILGLQIQRWPANVGPYNDNVVIGLLISLTFLFAFHFRWIYFYLNKNLKPILHDEHETDQDDQTTINNDKIIDIGRSTNTTPQYIRE